MLAELKLKVNGDLTRGREMMSLYKKIVKADEMVNSSHGHLKTMFPLYPAASCDDYYECHDKSTSYWDNDGYL